MERSSRGGTRPPLDPEYPARRGHGRTRWTGYATLCLSTLFISFIKRVLNLVRGVCVLWVPHKGETARKDAYIKGTGSRSNVGAGDLRASGRSDLKGSLPAGGGHVRCFHKKIVLTLDSSMTESGSGGSPYSFSQGTLAQWVEQRLCTPWVIGSSPIGSTPRRRGRSIKNRCARGDVIFFGMRPC